MWRVTSARVGPRITSLYVAIRRGLVSIPNDLCMTVLPFLDIVQRKPLCGVTGRSRFCSEAAEADGAVDLRAGDADVAQHVVVRMSEQARVAPAAESGRDAPAESHYQLGKYSTRDLDVRQRRADRYRDGVPARMELTVVAHRPLPAPRKTGGAAYQPRGRLQQATVNGSGRLRGAGFASISPQAESCFAAAEPMSFPSGCAGDRRGRDGRGGR